jgi:hypothetical protein
VVTRGICLSAQGGAVDPVPPCTSPAAAASGRPVIIVGVVTEHAHGETGHRHERPEDWGWHAEMGRTARVAGGVSIILLVLLVLSSHGSKWELVWLIGFAAALAVSLVWDRYRRRNAWRS